MLLSGAQQRMEAQPNLYQQLVDMEVDSPQNSVQEPIDLDLRRTFPDHPRLTPDLMEKMRRILLAYARRNPEVSYCQG